MDEADIKALMDRLAPILGEEWARTYTEGYKAGYRNGNTEGRTQMAQEVREAAMNCRDRAHNLGLNDWDNHHPQYAIDWSDFMDALEQLAGGGK